MVNDENLPTKFKNFIQKNLFDVDNLVLPDRQILGPENYRRAALVSVLVSTPNNTFNESLANFCQNQSAIRKIRLILFVLFFVFCKILF